LWSREYFIGTIGNVNSEDIQEYVGGRERPHKSDDFSVSEFSLNEMTALQA
jgi:hypothetical protein